MWCPNFPSHDLWRVSSKVKLCHNACGTTKCLCHGVVSDVLDALHMTPEQILAMNLVPEELIQEFHRVYDAVGETVEEGTDEHVVVRRYIPTPRGFDNVDDNTL